MCTCKLTFVNGFASRDSLLYFFQMEWGLLHIISVWNCSSHALLLNWIWNFKLFLKLITVYTGLLLIRGRRSISCVHLNHQIHLHLYLYCWFPDKLDGLKHDMKKHHMSSKASMEEFLQVADEYFAKQMQEPGKKRVKLKEKCLFHIVFQASLLTTLVS